MPHAAIDPQMLPSGSPLLLLDSGAHLSNHTSPRVTYMCYVIACASLALLDIGRRANRSSCGSPDRGAFPLPAKVEGRPS